MLSERLRTKILAGMFLFAMTYTGVVIFLFNSVVPDELRKGAAIRIFLFLCSLFAFEMLSLFGISRYIKLGYKKVPVVRQYLNAALEITAPSVVMLLLSADRVLAEKLPHSPLVYLYFLFIILSTLRLNFRISLFIGVLAAAEFLAVSQLMPHPETFGAIGKAMLLVLSGIGAAFVAGQIRRGVDRSLAAAEQSNKIVNLFGQQVSKEVVQEMMDRGGVVQTRMMNVCIMFVDIRNFTRYVSGKTPVEIVGYQNAFFRLIVDAVIRHQGIVNQFLGDGCMVTFGAPVALENPSRNAFEAALEIRRLLREEIAKGAIPATDIGIGIHEGDAVTGNIGPEIRQQYSITGSVVILAARIEQLNKEYNSQILVSESVMQKIGASFAAATEFLGRVDLKGWSTAIGIYKVAVALVLFCVGTVAAQAQAVGATPGGTDSVVMAANTSFDQASGTKRFILGNHYRKEWATAVGLPVLYLDSFAGGLKAVKLGGGMQTKSLRLEGRDGAEWVLRSVNKYPSKVIPEEFRGSVVEDVVQDQISSSNPYAPMVVAALAEAAGIFHTTPTIYFIPDQPALGAFAKDFSGTLCLLEERPVGNQTSNAAVGYSAKVVNSEKLFEKIFSDPRHKMDEKAFLRARLFDMWIGDWDRHEDQWLWASFREQGQTVYRPVPRDRDQAFSSLDGLLPQLAARQWALRKTQNFDYTIRDINGLNINGNRLDRKFTTALEWNDWLAVTTGLQQRLTDQVIDSAFGRMPGAVFAISGRVTCDKLKRRRDDLAKYARTYYEFLSRVITVTGTSRQETFRIERLNDDETRLTIREDRGPVTFSRVFHKNETKEIRLYGMGGDDSFHVAEKAGILVRTIGQGMPEPVRYDWIAPQIAPGYNPDDGLYLGGGIIIKKQRFGKSPYGYMQSFKANYAFATGAYNFWYEGLFKQAVGKNDLKLNAVVNAPNYVFNYFGQGNETKLPDQGRNYHRVRSDQLLLSAALVRPIGKYQTLEFGGSYQMVDVEYTPGRFLASSASKLDSTAFSRRDFGGLQLRYQFSNTDNALFPTEGLAVSGGAQLTQNLYESDRRFVRLVSDAAWYCSVHRLTAAFRLGAATNIGDYEFYQANTLGGSSNLRGYRNSRFAGRTSLYQNTELRYQLSTVNGYVARGKWGALSFIDNGRVWADDERSGKYHVGYGGGLWFLPYSRMAFTATYGVSQEASILRINAGFFF